jgi:hypothetical protein
MRWPEESFTCAPLSRLARIAWSLFRPVALRCLVLQLRLAEGSLDDWLCESVCAHADAASIEHAAHITVIFKNAFVIPQFIVAVSISKKPTPLSAVLKQINLGPQFARSNGD